MDENISRKAVLVLVLVSVVISILSTTLLMNTVYQINPSQPVQQQSENSAPSGRVSLTVAGAVDSSTSTGKVELTVK